MDLQVDKVLSRWIECWRSVFQTYAVMALDLPNSPPEKVATHWYVPCHHYCTELDNLNLELLA